MVSFSVLAAVLVVLAVIVTVLAVVLFCSVLFCSVPSSAKRLLGEEWNATKFSHKECVRVATVIHHTSYYDLRA